MRRTKLTARQEAALRRQLQKFRTVADRREGMDPEPAADQDDHEEAAGRERRTA